MANNISAEAKRLSIVFEEFKEANLGNNSVDFSKYIGIDQGTFSKIINGKYPINLTVIRGVCYKLGYNPEWFINGTGKKKANFKDKSTLTEVQMLRAEIDILTSRIKRLEARNGIGVIDKNTP